MYTSRLHYLLRAAIVGQNHQVKGNKVAHPKIARNIDKDFLCFSAPIQGRTTLQARLMLTMLVRHGTADGRMRANVKLFYKRINTVV